VFRSTLPVLLVAIIALSAWPASPGVTTHAYETQTIEVSAAGFNPPVCRMNRAFVRFKNAGPEPRRVILPGLHGDPPYFDTGLLKPGEVSNELKIEHGGSTIFRDAANLDHYVTVLTPVYAESWDPDCTPDPNLQPPVPLCRGNQHCLRLPAVSADG